MGKHSSDEIENKMEGDKISALKKTLKKWEAAFYETHEKKPTRQDIESAPQRIQGNSKQLHFEAISALFCLFCRSLERVKSVWTFFTLAGASTASDKFAPNLKY